MNYQTVYKELINRLCLFEVYKIMKNIDHIEKDAFLLLIICGN